MKDLRTTHLTVTPFMVRDLMALNVFFSIFPLVELITVTVYLQTFPGIPKQVFYRTEILFFF